MLPLETSRNYESIEKPTLTTNEQTESKWTAKHVTALVAVLLLVSMGVLLNGSGGINKMAPNNAKHIAAVQTVPDTGCVRLPVGSYVKLKSQVPGAGYLFECSDKWIYSNEDGAGDAYQFKVLPGLLGYDCSYTFQSKVDPSQYLSFSLSHGPVRLLSKQTGGHRQAQTFYSQPGKSGMGISLKHVYRLSWVGVTAQANQCSNSANYRVRMQEPPRNNLSISWLLVDATTTSKPTKQPSRQPTTSPIQPLTFTPKTVTIPMNPSVTIENGLLFWPPDHAGTYEDIQTVLSGPNGCGKLNVYFRIIRQMWSVSTASSCVQGANEVTITFPGTYPKISRRGAWGMIVTMKSDNSMTCVAIDGRVAHNNFPAACQMAGSHTSSARWPTDIFVAVQQPQWYTQSRPIEQINTNIGQLVRPIYSSLGLGLCPHFEITDSSNTKVKFVGTSCWFSNSDWMSIIGKQAGGAHDDVLVGVYISGGSWNTLMKFVECSVTRPSVSPHSTLISPGHQFPSGYGISATCAKENIKLLV